MIMKIFRRKKPLRIYLEKVGVIVSTESSIESGVNDKFNKKIVIYKNVEIKGNKVKWGKIIDEIPYTEEEALNLIKIKEIPLVEKNLSTRINLKEGEPLGDFIT